MRRRMTAWLLCACVVLGMGTPVAAERINLDPGSGGGASFRRGTGTISYESGYSSLTGEQEQLLLDFMHEYYTSLAQLQVGEPGDFYAADAGDEASYERHVWEVYVGIRDMQPTDLSLTTYSFELRVYSATKLADGSTKVTAFEDTSQFFAAYNGVESKLSDMGQSFVMKQTASGWKLTEHRQGDSMYNTIMKRSAASNSAAQRDAALSYARRAVENREGRGGGGALEADNDYNRSAAVSYARRYALERNSSWPMYDRYGGNCQNFVSQCLYAGGIPMDTTSPGLWKWYGNSPNTAYTASGRSASWSSVNDFLSYVRGNQGYGLVARADAPFYSGQAGDIIHMSTADTWTHTVLITETVKDAGGNTVDYLVASNTLNLVDYPASAYHYANQMLIKVYGWNND